MLTAALRVTCPASKIVQVFVQPGETVEEGAPLVAVEAMKTVHCTSRMPFRLATHAYFSAGTRLAGVEGRHRRQGRRQGG